MANELASHGEQQTAEQPVRMPLNKLQTLHLDGGQKWRHSNLAPVEFLSLPSLRSFRCGGYNRNRLGDLACSSSDGLRPASIALTLEEFRLVACEVDVDGLHFFLQRLPQLRLFSIAVAMDDSGFDFTPHDLGSLLRQYGTRLQHLEILPFHRKAFANFIPDQALPRIGDLRNLRDLRQPVISLPALFGG